MAAAVCLRCSETWRGKKKQQLCFRGSHLCFLRVVFIFQFAKVYTGQKKKWRNISRKCFMLKFNNQIQNVYSLLHVLCGVFLFLCPPGFLPRKSAFILYVSSKRFPAVGDMIWNLTAQHPRCVFHAVKCHRSHIYLSCRSCGVRATRSSFHAAWSSPSLFVCRPSFWISFDCKYPVAFIACILSLVVIYFSFLLGFFFPPVFALELR